jgi:hypothetical protein
VAWRALSVTAASKPPASPASVVSWTMAGVGQHRAADRGFQPVAMARHPGLRCRLLLWRSRRCTRSRLPCQQRRQTVKAALCASADSAWRRRRAGDQIGPARAPLAPAPPATWRRGQTPARNAAGGI